MSKIIDSFPTIEHAGCKFTFMHLMPTTLNLAAQEAEGGTINVRISYQTHVFSQKHEGQPATYVFRDEAGTLRAFCKNRYEKSLMLPSICKAMVQDNYLTWESKDRNKASNLAVTGPKLISGPNYLIVYYLFPSKSKKHNVELVVKSAYEKEINFDNIKRRNKICSLIKTAHFKQKKMP